MSQAKPLFERASFAAVRYTGQIKETHVYGLVMSLYARDDFAASGKKTPLCTDKMKTAPSIPLGMRPLVQLVSPSVSAIDLFPFILRNKLSDFFSVMIILKLRAVRTHTLCACERREGGLLCSFCGTVICQ